MEPFPPPAALSIEFSLPSFICHQNGCECRVITALNLLLYDAVRMCTCCACARTTPTISNTSAMTWRPRHATYDTVRHAHPCGEHAAETPAFGVAFAGEGQRRRVLTRGEGAAGLSCDTGQHVCARALAGGE